MPSNTASLIAIRSGSSLAGYSATPGSINSPSGTFTLATSSTGTSPSGSHYGVPLCGGICALFTHAQSLSYLADTPVTFTSNDGSKTQWVAGYLCIRNSGVPSKVVTPGITLSNWQEVVQ